MRPDDIAADITEVLITEQEVHEKIAELAREIERDLASEAGSEHPPLFVGVLTGAIMFMADLTREISFHTEFEFMSLSSYGSSTQSSGEVRIVKDLSTNIAGRDIVIVEDIVDTGLTLDWLVSNLRERGARTVRVCALLRKPEAAKVEVALDYLGFDIPNAFVVGYGLDYAGRYRNLRDIAVLSPSAIDD